VISPEACRALQNFITSDELRIFFVSEKNQQIESATVPSRRTSELATKKHYKRSRDIYSSTTDVWACQNFMLLVT